MQHYKYSVFKNLYPNPTFAYIRLFFGTHIKTTFTYPKTIFYSLRYNAGEKFVLRNTLLYPYTYELANPQEIEADPVNVSAKLLAAINEKDAIAYYNKNILNKIESISNTKFNVDTDPYSQKSKLQKVLNISNIINFTKNLFLNKNSNIFNNKKLLAILDENFESSFKTLYTIVDLNPDVDLPVAVYARILYAAAKLNEQAYREHKNQFQALNNETLKRIINKFIKKIEFADNDSISQVIYSANSYKYFNNTVWTELLKGLDTTNHTSGYTEVNLKAPFLFRYVEVKNSIKSFDEFGNILFSKNNKNLFEAFHAINNAGENKINIKEARNQLAENYEDILKDNYYKYTSSI